MIFSLALIGGGAAWLYSLANAAQKLSINVTQVAIVGIEQASLKMWAEITIDNFSGHAFTITQPLLKVYLMDSEVGNSEPSEETHAIKKRARTKLKVNLFIPLTNIPALAPLLLKGQKANRTLKLEVFTQADGIPYKAEKIFTI